MIILPRKNNIGLIISSQLFPQAEKYID